VGLFGKKPADEARRNLPALEVRIAALRAEVEDLEKQVRVAWGKKWSSMHIAERRRSAANEFTLAASSDENGRQRPAMAARSPLGLDIREQVLTADLKGKKADLEKLLSEEHQLRELAGR
jgi:hypothetical protein